MADDLESVKRKIRGLLALAKEGSGATEPERDTARRLADKFLRAFKLTEADCAEKLPERSQRPVHQPFYPGFVVVVNVGGGFGFGGTSSCDTTNSCSGFGNDFFFRMG